MTGSSAAGDARFGRRPQLDLAIRFEHLIEIEAAAFPLVQPLERQLARAMPRLGRERRRHACRSCRNADRRRVKCAISIAATAASQPLLVRSGAARSIASSGVLTVSTPNVIGTPVSIAAFAMPCDTADEMYSKCGVPPRIRQP